MQSLLYKQLEIRQIEFLPFLTLHSRFKNLLSFPRKNLALVDFTKKNVFTIFFRFLGEFIRDLVALESGGSGGVVWRIRANSTKLVCAVGSRNGTEETKLLVLDFDVHDSK